MTTNDLLHSDDLPLREDFGNNPIRNSYQRDGSAAGDISISSALGNSHVQYVNAVNNSMSSTAIDMNSMD